MNEKIFQALNIEIEAAQRRASESRKADRAQRHTNAANRIISFRNWLARQDPSWVKDFAGNRIGVYFDGGIFFNRLILSSAQQYGWDETQSYESPESPAKKSNRFSSELNRRAWAIRREAAARLGVALMSVSWKICLEMARSN